MKMLGVSGADSRTEKRFKVWCCVAERFLVSRGVFCLSEQIIYTLMIQSPTGSEHDCALNCHHLVMPAKTETAGKPGRVCPGPGEVLDTTV